MTVPCLEQEAGMLRASKEKENPIGRKIRQRRVQLGLSQEDLGERLGVSYQQVQKYEKGVSQLTVGRLQEIAHSLHVPVDYFLKDLPKMKEAPVSYGGLSTEERRLLKQYRAISSPPVRMALLRLIQAVLRLTDTKSSP